MKKFRAFMAICLVVCMALSMVACTTEKKGATDETTSLPETGSTLGEGAKSFTFEVEKSDGTKYSYTIKTDKESVGEALQELKLIAGEDGDYGLYVKTVLDQTLDYEADGYWWCLYIDGESAMTSVDSTPVVEGSTYAFVATPA